MDGCASRAAGSGWPETPADLLLGKSVDNEIKAFTPSVQRSGHNIVSKTRKKMEIGGSTPTKVEQEIGHTEKTVNKHLGTSTTL